MDQTVSLQAILSSTHSFEVYETLNLNADIIAAIVQEIIERHQLPETPLNLFSEGTNIVFAYGEHTGYASNTLTPALSHQLMALMLLHKYSNLKVQVRIKDWTSKVKNLKDLENLVWGF